MLTSLQFDGWRASVTKADEYRVLLLKYKLDGHAFVIIRSFNAILCSDGTPIPRPCGVFCYHN